MLTTQGRWKVTYDQLPFIWFYLLKHIVQSSLWQSILGTGAIFVYQNKFQTFTQGDEVKGQPPPRTEIWQIPIVWFLNLKV